MKSSIETTPLRAPHSLPAARVAEALAVDPERGLDQSTAADRLEQFGPNSLQEREGPTKLKVLLRQFTNALVITLLVAAFVSGALLADWIDSIVILAIVILNAAIGYSQEVRAADAAEGLRRLAAPTATVVRDGAEAEIPTEEIVPGDVIRVAAGDRVFADARILNSSHLRIDESELTGESVPVDKAPDPVDAEAALADQSSMVYSGTVVVAGRATAVVTGTGTQTEIGRIAEMLGEEEPPTPLENELDRVGRRLGFLAVAVALVVFAIGIAQGNAVETMFLLAVALAVAAIPEGLPAVVGITLGRGVQSMAKRNAIVRRMPAVEALGAVTVICTDKTGTLTKNEIWVQEAKMAEMNMEQPDAPVADPRIGRYAELAVLCNDARQTPDGWKGDPTEIALLRSASHLLDADALRQRAPRHDEIPFDSTRKRMTTVHAVESGRLIAVKGAPEVVIPMCTMLEGEAGPHALSSDRAQAALEEADEMADRGLRTMALAYRVVGDDVANDDLEQELTLVALAGMRDELRPEAHGSVAEAEHAGITVVMITGDHEVTARSIADELDLLDGRRVMGRAELLRLSDEEFAEVVDDVGAYARVDPTDKVKIVKAWQARDEIVAMTGDGINDAPALRISDIGVAMGSGTDVARDASDMVLADNNFATIVTAVREGRTIFANLRKVIAFLLAANVSEVVVVFLGFLLFASMGEPLLATQLLWVNLVTDGFPALALGFDPPDPAVMRRPPERKRSLLSWDSQLRLLVRGTILAGAVLTAFGVGMAADYPWEQTRTLAFTVLVLVQMTYLYGLRVLESGWREGLTTNGILHLAVLISVVLQVIVVTTPVGNTMFRTVAISFFDWVIAVGLAVGAALVVVAVSTFIPRMRDRRS